MTNKDKVLAAFLASVGIFSAVQAMQYVGTLSEQDKNLLLPAAQVSSENVFLCAGSAVNEAIVEVEKPTSDA
jgi:hypothetical protein